MSLHTSPQAGPWARFRGTLELGSAQLPTAAWGNSSTQEKLDRCKVRMPQPESPRGAVYACVHACMCAYAHACVCMHICMYMCVHVCPCACVHVCMRICVHLCMHMCTCACNPAQPGVQFQRGRGRENRIAHQEPLKEKDLGSANRFNFAADLRNHRATFLRLLFQPAQQMEGSISRLFPFHIALPWGQHGFVQTPWTRQQGWRACHASSPSHSPCSAALDASGGQQSPGKLLPAPPGEELSLPVAHKLRRGMLLSGSHVNLPILPSASPEVTRQSTV